MGNFVHLYLTIRWGACKIYMVLCTLVQYGTAPQRFIDNRRNAGGLGFTRPIVTFILLNELIEFR